jgi:hypothetical protein
MAMKTRLLSAASIVFACSPLLGCEASVEAEPPCEGEGVICNYMGNGEAGLGEDGVSAQAVSLYLPQDLSFGPDDQPYVLDWNNHRVRTLEGNQVRTVIGTGYLGDAPNGPAIESSMNHPTHVGFDSQGRLILSAWHNSKVMRFDPETEEITNLCGTGGRNYAGDGGPAMTAILDLPVATAFDAQERMYIMDQANQRIRRVDEQDVITTVVGPDETFEPAPMGFVPVCTEDAMTGATSCKLCAEAEADDPKCAPRKPQGFAGDDATGDDVLMYQPFSQSAPPAGRMEMGPDDVLYFTDTGNHRVRAYHVDDGTVETVAGSGPDTFDRNFKGGYEGDGGPATEALLKNPTDVAVTKDGVLFIADTHNSCVRKVEDGEISTVAGVCGERGYDGDGGPADEALLNRPYGIALGPEGNLYIADTHNHRIRVVYGAF